MIGFYDYTVVLTYLSMISATTGIMLCLNDIGHPYLGMFFLMFCGLCDAFDGKVARTKKDRTEQMKKFGIQIDSLSDLVAFGVLPACIGIAMLRSSIEFSIFPDFKFLHLADKPAITKILLTATAVLYALAAMIRLAYFNVTEEERQGTEGGSRKVFTGDPALLCLPRRRRIPLCLTDSSEKALDTGHPAPHRHRGCGSCGPRIRLHRHEAPVRPDGRTPFPVQNDSRKDSCGVLPPPPIRWKEPPMKTERRLPSRISSIRIPSGPMALRRRKSHPISITTIRKTSP